MKQSNTISPGWLSTLSLVFVLAFSPTASGQITFDNARGDFVAVASDGHPDLLSATGTGTWTYLDSATPKPDDSGVLNQLTWRAANSSYIRFTSLRSANAVDLQNATFTSEEIRVPPSGRDPKFAVVRWEAGPDKEGLNLDGIDSDDPIPFSLQVGDDFGETDIP